MTPAAHALHDFVNCAARSLCYYSDLVDTHVSETANRVVTLIVSCHKDDVRYLDAKSRAITQIAIGIAQRHNSFVRLVIDDGGSDKINR